jgi:PKD repeat protein
MKYQKNKSSKEMILKGKVLSLIMIFSLLVTCVNAYNSYTWNVKYGCFTVATNWTPTRTTPAADDVLNFDGSNVNSLTLCTVTTIQTQAIGQLNVINNCTVTFISPATVTLTVGTTDVSNPALYVASSSQLIFGGGFGMTLALNSTYGLGSVYGDIIDSQTAAVTMALTSLTTNGIIFYPGSSFQDAPVGVYPTINCFSGSTLLSIVFEPGASLYLAGTKTSWSNSSVNDPWFSAEPASLINLLSGSTCYVWNPAKAMATFASRTVGYLIMNTHSAPYNIPGNTGQAGAVVLNDMVFKSTAVSQLTTSFQVALRILGNFIVESGSAGMCDNENGNVNPLIFEVQGNFTCAGTFICNTATGASSLATFNNRCYLLDGSSPQTLYLGSNVATFGQLSVNNASGITLLSSLSVLTVLKMGNGNINTNGNTLSLGTSLNSSWGILSRNATNNPWIIGNFQRWIPSGSAVAYGFPVGAANYDGATIDFTGSAPSGAGFISVSFTTTNPGGNSIALGPDSSGNYYYDVASSGYWTINNGVTISGNPNLWLDVNDIAGLPTPITEDGIVESGAVYPSSAAWSITGTSASSNTGSLIESAGIALPSGTSYYGIASPTTNFSPPVAGFYATPVIGNGPLPVYFYDTSANIPSSWGWTFGDGGSSSLKNPTHTYGALAFPTSYNVTLVASNAYGSSTATYLNYISIGTAAGPLSSGVIWNFDTLSPATVLHQGYMYVYGYSNTNGIGGSNALQIDVPYKAAGARHSGQAIWMSNYAGFSLNPVSPYNGTIGNNLGNINLSASTVAFFYILASNTTNFGLSFTMFDTTGKFFVQNGDIYLSGGNSTTVATFTSGASTTSFQQIFFNIADTHAYKAGKSTVTATSPAPVLTNIEAFEWFFSCSDSAGSGQGVVPNDLKFWIDNVGASSMYTTPVELLNFEAVENQKY